MGGRSSDSGLNSDSGRRRPVFRYINLINFREPGDVDEDGFITVSEEEGNRIESMFNNSTRQKTAEELENERKQDAMRGKIANLQAEIDSGKLSPYLQEKNRRQIRALRNRLKGKPRNK